MAQWAKYMENKFNYESKAEQSASRINILTTTYESVTQIVFMDYKSQLTEVKSSSRQIWVPYFLLLI